MFSLVYAIPYHSSKTRVTKWTLFLTGDIQNLAWQLAHVCSKIGRLTISRLSLDNGF